jgi:hypothetical protein
MRYRLRTLLILLAVCMPQVAYIAGYFSLGRYRVICIERPPVPARYEGQRVFPKEWLATIYAPAAEVETHVLGGFQVNAVYTGHR